jgi:hypothetical protein
LLSLRLFRKSGGPTVNLAYIKRALAISQVIFKPKSLVVFGLDSLLGPFPHPHRHLNPGVQMVAKASNDPPPALFVG